MMDSRKLAEAGKWAPQGVTMRTRTDAKTWLVTGATGFLGRHLLRELLGRGDRVRALVRRPPIEPLPAGVELASGDVLGAETLDAAVDGCDGVFHLAGRVMREGQRDQLYALHVDGTANLLRAMDRVGCRRVVVASTSGTVAVSKSPAVFDDDAPYSKLSSRWPYYESKVYQEQVATQLGESLGLEVVLLRPSLLLGPEDYGRSSTDDVRRYIRGEFPVVPGGGLSFLDVRDCAATFARAMTLAPAGSRYLLGAANLSVHDFFTLVARIADVDPPIATVPDRVWRFGVDAIQVAGRMGLIERPDRVAMDMARFYWYADWSRAVAELGHAPRAPVQTLEDTIAWLQDYEEPLPVEGAPGQLLRLPWRSRHTP